MGVRKQDVKINYSLTTLKRNVYSITRNEKFNYETGYVNFENIRIAVWRPIDSNDMSFEAPWRSGLWRNLYIQRIEEQKGAITVACVMTDVEVNGLKVKLPQVVNDVTLDFKEHLKAQ